MSKQDLGDDEGLRDRNATMNAIIRDRVQARSASTGGVERLAGVPEPVARLRAAQANLERAEAARDELAVDYFNRVVEERLAEARAARGEQPRDEVGQFASFDGGVMGGRKGVAPPGGGRRDETAAALFVRAMQKSARERTEREAA
ncbi:MAG: hypothetical protein ACYCU0_03155 [Solirubrobacteraceae bacterium]